MSAPSFSAISHEQFLADVRALAIAIEESGWRPDHLVGIGRGGLVPGVFLSHLTGVPLLSLDHSAGVPAFGRALIAPLAGLARAGHGLLLVDDINDSGGTIAMLRDAMGAAGAPGEWVRVAVLIDNVRSAARVDYRARVIDRRHEKSWFVFPWERMADDAAIAAEAMAQPGRLA